MNKDFEKEYLEYSAKDTPDLWSRIEAGIDELENENSNVIPITAKPKKSIKRYAGLIAAAACVVIAIPAIVLISKGGGANYSAAPAAETANFAAATSNDACEAAACDEAIYEEAEAPACDEATYEEAGVAAGDEETCEADTFELQAVNLKGDEVSELDADGSANVRAGEKEDPPVFACWGAECDVSNIKSNIISYADVSREEGVVITPQEELTDFRVLKINITSVSDDGQIAYDSEELYNLPSAAANKPILLLAEFMGDLPEYAISFKDSDGNECVMSISVSGRDGSIVLERMNQ